MLRRGADFTATDKKCFTPILACAKDDNVALCLASMLVEYFKNSSAEGSNRASVGKDKYIRKKGSKGGRIQHTTFNVRF